MDAVMSVENISVYEYPVEVDCGEWIVNHPDCDTVCEQIGSGSKMLVYAYATSKKGNEPLHAYRDKNLSNKKILKGVSIDGIRRLI